MNNREPFNCFGPAVLRTLILASLCAGSITTVAGAGNFTEGREIAPLPEEVKPGEFVWIPEVSPAGPVVVIVSIPEQALFVYRNGVQIGRTAFWLDKKAVVHGNHVYSALDREDAHGRHDWQSTTSIGGGEAPDIKALAGLTDIPPAFLEKVRPIIEPGSTMILTDLPVSSQTRSSGQDFRILTTDSAK